MKILPKTDVVIVGLGAAGGIAAHPFLAINGMVGKLLQQEVFDQGLTAAVQLQLDVVRLVGIDIQRTPKMRAKKSPRRLRGLNS